MSIMVSLNEVRSLCQPLGSDFCFDSEKSSGRAIDQQTIAITHVKAQLEALEKFERELDDMKTARVHVTMKQQ